MTTVYVIIILHTDQEISTHKIKFEIKFKIKFKFNFNMN